MGVLVGAGVGVFVGEGVGVLVGVGVGVAVGVGVGVVAALTVMVMVLDVPPEILVMSERFSSVHAYASVQVAVMLYVPAEDGVNFTVSERELAPKELVLLDAVPALETEQVMPAIFVPLTVTVMVTVSPTVIVVALALIETLAALASCGAAPSTRQSTTRKENKRDKDFLVINHYLIRKAAA